MERGSEQLARLQRFAGLVGEPRRDVPLDAATAAIAAVLQGRPLDGTAAVLDELAVSCDDPTFEGLRRHLFVELAFGGHSGAYDDPQNSFLDVVLDRRRGLPILLATVMIEVGRRAGVPVVGVGMPMHFLVRSGLDDDAFVDPFTGDAFDRRGARHRFDAVTAGRVAWSEHHLDPTGSRSMVVRMLSNLRATYERRRDPVQRAHVAWMRSCMPELAAEAPDAVRLGAIFN
ncbi:MAG: transglutaminase-like domain-containing protein [Ilumatobacteraceae bacterium]